VPTGARLTFCYFRFGGVRQDVPDGYCQDLKDFCRYFRPRLAMYKALVSDNYILRKRCEEIGVLPLEMAKHFGATGPVIRGSGEKCDIRRTEPYSVYPELDFEVPVYPQCDAMARYLVRMDEMEQSIKIIEQAADMMPQGEYILPKAPKRDVYFSVEGARGKIGVYIASDGSAVPYRIKLRSPSFSNLSLFPELARGTLLADAISILGSLDLLIPEIDR